VYEEIWSWIFGSGFGFGFDVGLGVGFPLSANRTQFKLVTF